MPEPYTEPSASSTPRVSAPPPFIRPARRSDEDRLGVLTRDAWSPLHAVAPRPAAPYEPFFDDRHEPSHYLVAEVDGDVMGFIRVVPPTPLASNRHVRQIQGLEIDEAARRRGVGRALLRAAYETSRRQGATRLTLRVLGHNAPARALYEAEGFVVEGIQPGEFLIEGEYVDDVLMGRSLLDS
ncbi:GNAT family N-acetyltransferase [Streptomyces sp. NPDC048416]|uniref:GNAT family N-acetyltransferase n=1 Tax=Streptomyces sp. NPDC048416 TaxID=3365546 RepID=UPI003724AE2D